MKISGQQWKSMNSRHKSLYRLEPRGNWNDPFNPASFTESVLCDCQCFLALAPTWCLYVVIFWLPWDVYTFHFKLISCYLWKLRKVCIAYPWSLRRPFFYFNKKKNLFTFQKLSKELRIDIVTIYILQEII